MVSFLGNCDREEQKYDLLRLPRIDGVDITPSLY